jgi:hypothetical protein
MNPNIISMKALISAGILLLSALLVCGCMTTAPPQEDGTAVTPAPSLLGNWSGTMTGYRGVTGFTDYPGASMVMQVTGQHDRVFAGEFIFTNQSGLVTTVEFGGVVGRDGRTLTIVERNGGYSFGTIVAPDEIELIHADDTEPSDIAIDSLKKI